MVLLVNNLFLCVCELFELVHMAVLCADTCVCMCGLVNPTLWGLNTLKSLCLFGHFFGPHEENLFIILGGAL